MTRARSFGRRFVWWITGCTERRARLTHLQKQRCDREVQRKRQARAALADHLALQEDA